VEEVIRLLPSKVSLVFGRKCGDLSIKKVV
jgi:hypothetical protein